MDQTLTSMQMDKKDMKDTMVDQPTTAGSGPKGPQYPWGLEVRLEDAALKKMKVKLSDYAVGDVVELHAQCKVTRLSQSANGDTGNSRTLELQITDMCLEAGGESDTQKEKDDELSWDEENPEKTDRELKKRGF